jgi:integrase
MRGPAGRGGPQARSAVRLGAGAGRPVPVLTPPQVEAILDECARWDAAAASWAGSVRDRLLLATLAETGMRLGEALSTRHCDWHAGRGGTPFVEVVPRQDHPAGVRVKNSRYRRIFISDELERLHSEYVWQLCDAGAHRVLDLENHFVSVNLRRGQWLAPMRPETVYDLAASLKRRLGARVPPGWTPHWFRHSHASASLNAGAPVHVVQRYLGHLSPEMAMRYAATLASTAGREFLATVKIGRDGREAGMDRRDMPDLMQLDRRTDRVLPNGYCLLPPVRSCDKGNACHGCDHFATDKTYLPEIRRQLAATGQLIEQRQAQHLARYGEPMGERNVWLEQRLAEVRSMRLEITALEAQPDGDTTAVRGAGVCGRPGYQPGPVPVILTARPAKP